jgi:two-component system phosphate regulon sensor histidine kinase PhoR
MLSANLIKKKEASINNQKVAEYISVIIKENHKLEKNVEEILKVTCAGNDNCSIEEINIHEVISNTSNEFTTRVESLSGQLTNELSAKKYIINAAPGHFKLIFSNLIDNAIKYSGDSPQIKISSQSTANVLQVKIIDKGIGIEKKDLSKIFEKYYRVSTGDVHNVKGFGLGLTYVKKLIEHYKGKIEVSSSKGIGTVFTITLPLKNEAN